MTLYLELYDSVTDDLLAKALDREYDRQTGYFQWQNSVTNWQTGFCPNQTWESALCTKCLGRS